MKTITAAKCSQIKSPSQSTFVKERERNKKRQWDSLAAELLSDFATALQTAKVTERRNATATCTCLDH